VTLTKTRDGLQASTTLSLGTIATPDGPGERILEITTRKDTRGGITSHAYVYVQRGSVAIGYTKTFELVGDYRSGRLTAPNRYRATEKNIRLVHAEALQRVDQCLANAHAFYAAKTAPDA